MTQQTAGNASGAKRRTVRELRAENEALLAYTKELEAEVDRLTALLGPEYHVAQIGADGWTFQHPIGCRPNLLACRFNDIAQRDWQRAPAPLGRYRADLDALDRIVLGPLDPSDNDSQERS